MVELSVIIPAWNEEHRLVNTLAAIAAYLKEQPYQAEMIVVDDGSTDGTRKMVLDWSQLHWPVSVIAGTERQGKGAAVRLGVNAAQGDYLLVMDADGAASIRELDRLWTVQKETGASIVIGSRAKRSQETHVRGHWYRTVMGRTFTWMLWRLTPGIADTQCGFKLFERTVAQKLFARQQETTYGYDVEILHMAQQNGIPIEEVPINWTNIPGSKVNLITDSWDMFRALFRISSRSRAGQYRL